MNSLPVVVIGAGPVGLAAAAHLLGRGIAPLVLEAGPTVGHGIMHWAHVRMFSQWRHNLDTACTALLERHGWVAPDPDRYPTGREVVERYLQPLAGLPEIEPVLRTGARVLAISRKGRDRMSSERRESDPFVVRYLREGAEHEILARGVIDASGTISAPNPLGSSGLPALGERAAAARIAYGLPDVLGADRGRYAGRRVLVAGSGHSAFNVLQDLAELARQAPGTRVHWVMRRDSLARVLGGGENDRWKERGRLGARIGTLVAEGAIALTRGFRVERVEIRHTGVVVAGNGRDLAEVDEVVSCTGFRPDLGLLSELRLELDPATESPVALAPLIDPNLHSCGTVRPHGALELRHPEADLYVVGMKSYGRAPTFLLLTGYEQVRSVAAALAGDWEAARRVELDLPETGVCNTQFVDGEPVAASGACCGGPASPGTDACCVRDADAKAAGQPGCGCDSAPVSAPAPEVAPARAACCR